MAQLFDAVDYLNECWQQIIEDGDTKTRPWIIWEERRVVVTQFTNHPRIIHE